MSKTNSYDRTRTLIAEADRVFKKRSLAWQWIMRKHPELNNKSPWNLTIDSQFGFERALAVLHKGEHGIPV